MDEKRESPRRSLLWNIPVCDEFSGDALGLVVDVSLRGAQVLGLQAFEQKKVYRMRCELPGEVVGRSSVSLVAQCQWVRFEEHPVRYVGGFSFVECDLYINGKVSLVFKVAE